MVPWPLRPPQSLAGPVVNLSNPSAALPASSSFICFHSLGRAGSSPRPRRNAISHGTGLILCTYNLTMYMTTCTGTFFYCTRSPVVLPAVAFVRPIGRTHAGGVVASRASRFCVCGCWLQSVWGVVRKCACVYGLGVGDDVRNSHDRRRLCARSCRADQGRERTRAATSYIHACRPNDCPPARLLAFALLAGVLKLNYCDAMRCGGGRLGWAASASST